jgi:GDPmannose 4,6-dehydratase
VTRLQGDYSKVERLLGWQPKTSFTDLINMMVDADVQSVHALPAGRDV